MGALFFHPGEKHRFHSQFALVDQKLYAMAYEANKMEISGNFVQMERWFRFIPAVTKKWSEYLQRLSVS